MDKVDNQQLLAALRDMVGGSPSGESWTLVETTLVDLAHGIPGFEGFDRESVAFNVLVKVKEKKSTTFDEVENGRAYLRTMVKNHLKDLVKKQKTDEKKHEGAAAEAPQQEEQKGDEAILLSEAEKHWEWFTTDLVELVGQDRKADYRKKLRHDIADLAAQARNKATREQLCRRDLEAAGKEATPQNMKKAKGTRHKREQRAREAMANGVVALRAAGVLDDEQHTLALLLIDHMLRERAKKKSKAGQKT